MSKRALYMPDKFVGRLRQLIADKGVSTKQAQRDLKVSSSTMYAWLNDERIMSVVNFFEVCEYFDVNPLWLYGLTDNRTGFKG